MQIDRLSVDDVAKRWDKNPETIRRYVRAGKLVAGTSGLGRNSGYRFEIAEIERFERDVLGITVSVSL